MTEVEGRGRLLWVSPLVGGRGFLVDFTRQGRFGLPARRPSLTVGDPTSPRRGELKA
jgi:hypothetical protein